MEKNETKKAETLAKFKAARDKKRAFLARLEESMKKAYKERTGKEADNFFAL